MSSSALLLARLRHDGGGLEWAHAVVVVVGVELLEMQDAGHAGCGVPCYAHRAAGDGVVTLFVSPQKNCSQLLMPDISQDF